MPPYKQQYHLNKSIEVLPQAIHYCLQRHNHLHIIKQYNTQISLPFVSLNYPLKSQNEITKTHRV